MRTLNVSISEIEYKKFGIKKDKLTFTDFMEEITNEVKAVRKNAKNRN